MDIHILTREELNDEMFPLALKVTVATALWTSTPSCQVFCLSSWSRNAEELTHNRLHQENMGRSLPCSARTDLNVVLSDTRL
jgi:hypothetical protein